MYTVYEANTSSPKTQSDYTEREYEGDFEQYARATPNQGSEWLTEAEYSDLPG